MAPSVIVEAAAAAATTTATATTTTTTTTTSHLNGNTLVTVKQSQHGTVNGIANGQADKTVEAEKPWARYANPALYVTPDHRVEVRETPIPTPTASQVLIHVRATGVCGSDLHLWRRGAIGPLTVDQAHVLGHEAAGVVLQTGSAVTGLRPGDRVAIEPQVPCHTCFLCAQGRYNLCEGVHFCGVGAPGTMRRFIVHEARYCHRMPATMTFAQGALLEPLSVILHAVRQCEGAVAVGRPALVCGAGPIGLIGLAVARASGAWPLVITDVDAARLEFARTFVPGAQTYHIQPGKSPLQAAEEVRRLFGCAGDRDVERAVPDADEYRAPAVVLECTGVEASVITAAYSCRRGGVVMVVGVGRSTMHNLPFMHLSLAEIGLRFINRYADTWPAGINALANGGQVLNLDALVTHRLPLERAVELMELCADPATPSIKVQLVDDVDVPLE